MAEGADKYKAQCPDERQWKSGAEKKNVMEIPRQDGLKPVEVLVSGIRRINEVVKLGASPQPIRQVMSLSCCGKNQAMINIRRPLSKDLP